ncbi:hypothetical protein P170DRAFT_430833 [Aspergillus steynii IBT 23096]|uniref:Uncharacterized protein n=1 Tax=Aspergillus steynii IBT 23096 TaxID=1392250 RepID=A0A2I2FT40_9EURO|nr:uncharacterized protein P170DRAFT_430833 [Aspergillus steynii IBT 23096]PLB43813.1 hypothetical protein P170DRAFT_430833 [Aspergillus steynii IBT 23096]
MPVLVEFDPIELLSGEDNRLKRQAHCMKVKSCAPTWAHKVTLFQCAHQSDLDPRRHITYWAWNEKGECFGPYHENFSYQQEQDFIAMIESRPAPVSTSSSSSVSSTSSTGSAKAREPALSKDPLDDDNGKPFQLVTRKRGRSSYSAEKVQSIGNIRF